MAISKDDLVQFIFSGTRCWCHPSKDGLYFESLHSDEILVARWDDVEAVASTSSSVEEGFEDLHGVAVFDSHCWAAD